MDAAAAAVAKLLQSCPTLSDPMDCSLPGSSIHASFVQFMSYSATTHIPSVYQLEYVDEK